MNGEFETQQFQYLVGTQILIFHVKNEKEKPYYQSVILTKHQKFDTLKFI